MNEIKEYTTKIFEEIKHIDESSNEYWYARELQSVLEYTQWRSINDLIERAKIACKESKYNVDDYFAVHRKMIKLAKGATRNIVDYKLSRYACYLIVMNGNPKKEIIALAQTYFAIQARKQELLEQEPSEDEKRLILRDKTRKGNYNLNRTALDDIAKRKKLRYREEILDNMGSEELGTNLFRITQTDAKLKRDRTNTEERACNTHYQMGKDIRNFIKKHGGTMPEDLLTPKTSLKELETKETLK